MIINNLMITMKMTNKDVSNRVQSCPINDWTHLFSTGLHLRGCVQVSNHFCYISRERARNIIIIYICIRACIRITRRNSLDNWTHLRNLLKTNQLWCPIIKKTIGHNWTPNSKILHKFFKY